MVASEVFEKISDIHSQIGIATTNNSTKPQVIENDFSKEKKEQEFKIRKNYLNLINK
jgi:hypothetical protein